MNAAVQTPDLLGDAIPPAASTRKPSSNPSFVAAIRQSIQRTLDGNRIAELVGELRPGAFVRLESRDRGDFVGREILATYIDQEQPHHSCISVAKWRIDGVRAELVVSITAVTSVVSPLQARYAFDRLDRADVSAGAIR